MTDSLENDGLAWLAFSLVIVGFVLIRLRSGRLRKKVFARANDDQVLREARSSCERLYAGKKDVIITPIKVLRADWRHAPIILILAQIGAVSVGGRSMSWQIHEKVMVIPDRAQEELLGRNPEIFAKIDSAGDVSLWSVDLEALVGSEHFSLDPREP
jgi:hypothetical protein